jgi:dephospho-CoA kinase
MKVIGITGGIGSGKSLVCRVFKLLGVPVYDADAAAKRLMETDPQVRNEIIRSFGPASFLNDGHLNRRYLAGIVFNDPEQLNKLNGIVHPAVAKDFKIWKSTCRAEYVIREAAILLESGTYHDLDGIILIESPEALQIQRVKERDNRSEEEIKSIISRQWTSENKRKYANFIIQNNLHTLLLPQILQIHRALTHSTT